MAMVHITTQVSSDELLSGVERLSTSELDQFVHRVLALQAKRKATSVSQEVTQLLLKINQGLPSEVQKRYDELSAKQREETISQSEHEELLELIEQIAKLDAERIRLLAELARIRQTSLSALMEDLGIRTPTYV